jgi:hypothetical protein
MPASVGPTTSHTDPGDIEGARTESPELDLSWQARTDSLSQAPEYSVSVKEVGADSDSETFDAGASENVELIGREDLPSASGTSRHLSARIKPRNALTLR